MWGIGLTLLALLLVAVVVAQVQRLMGNSRRLRVQVGEVLLLLMLMRPPVAVDRLRARTLSSVAEITLVARRISQFCALQFVSLFGARSRRAHFARQPGCAGRRVEWRRH